MGVCASHSPLLSKSCRLTKELQAGESCTPKSPSGPEEADERQRGRKGEPVMVLRPNKQTVKHLATAVGAIKDK